ncbi:Do family serine endopeptidase [Leeia aquatica]|uniref:Do family serine endopeptidase n=1 Tax=Leeia aquatica TaxID=2725557 RepID=A0A847SHZ4_9NEIS|nr:Do family serine endopeptidase [Leeia aquatica]NLR76789.1 Do family serine endopeptidase [Leeia aquatica]
MKKLWLIFAQTLTVCLGVWAVVGLFRPEWGLPIQQPRPVTLPPPAAHAASGPVAAPTTNSFSPAVQAAIPSVVNVFTSKQVRRSQNPLLEDPFFKRFFGDRQDSEEDEPSSSLGSGVIVSKDGFIITNNHVIEAADEIKVALSDGRKLTATLVGADPDTDLAVLKIDAGKDLPAIHFGNPEQVKVGDVVLAIGQPFGFGQTVTLGIVSALGRNHLGLNTFENFIQTDAAINPGNSGGALVDHKGQLIGINSAIYSQSGGSQGIGFAIPVTTARNVMEQIIQNGSVTRGWIGVEVQDLNAELATSFNLDTSEGALIAGVVRNGPADKAGVKSGDLLVEIDGKTLKDSYSMLDIIAALKPGISVKVRLLRNNQSQEVMLTVGKRPRLPRR